MSLTASTSEPTVLVVGATGPVAGLTVPALLARGARVRALVRTSAQANRARAAGAHEIVIGDLREPAGLADALRGADGVFHIGPAFAADEAQMGVDLVERAEAAGVRRFAFSGVMHPANGLANHTSKQPVERALFASRMAYTILHPTTFMQNLRAGWAGAVADGVFREPFSVTARIARVDYRDVAEVAAIALTEDRLAHGTYELCAAGLPDRHDIAATMSDVLGQPVIAGEVPFAEWASATGLPYDARQIELLGAVFASYDAHDLAGSSFALRSILGREPRTLRDYIDDLAHGGA